MNEALRAITRPPAAICEFRVYECHGPCHRTLAARGYATGPLSIFQQSLKPRRDGLAECHWKRNPPGHSSSTSRRPDRPIRTWPAVSGCEPYRPHGRDPGQAAMPTPVRISSTSPSRTRKPRFCSGAERRPKRTQPKTIVGGGPGLRASRATPPARSRSRRCDRQPALPIAIAARLTSRRLTDPRRATTGTPAFRTRRWSRPP